MPNQLQTLFNNGTTALMPALFMGHGSPMNGISDNIFTQQWTNLGNQLPVPKAVLCISAHWLTQGTHVTAMADPRTIHDFGGFPPELYQVQYPAPGHPALAAEIAETVQPGTVELNHDRGLDHGCWTVVRHMYPRAQVPVLQLSIDFGRPLEWHYRFAQLLKSLRQKGVLIIGSGNMVHNLRMVAWDKINDFNYGFDWAVEANHIFKKLIVKRQHGQLVNYDQLGQAVKLAVPTPDHWIPLIYTLALQHDHEHAAFFNDNCTAGSLSMTSVILSANADHLTVLS